MTKGILYGVDGYFEITDDGLLEEISESRAKDLQSKLDKLHNKPSEDTLEAKCEKFIELLQEAYPLIVGVGSLLYGIHTIIHNKEIRKYNADMAALEIRPRINKLKQEKAYPDREIARLQDEKLDVSLKIAQATTDWMDAVISSQNNLENDNRLDFLNSRYDKLNDKIAELTQTSSLKAQDIETLEKGIKLQNQTNFFDHLKDYSTLTPGVIGLWYVIQNPKKIFEATKDMFFIGGEIIYIIGANTFDAIKNSCKSICKSIKMPKIKMMNTGSIDSSEIEKIDVNYDEEDYKCVYDKDYTSNKKTEVAENNDIDSLVVEVAENHDMDSLVVEVGEDEHYHATCDNIDNVLHDTIDLTGDDNMGSEAPAA
ncbi:hypothetical protein phytr_3360 [Candidatus Phycorickettsia trachydisci]|uniref:Uncharacterized protein n=1 Tax=Candidatus Phycorickettsia trachydisci TaxID=2115978 RepID=A0A2P1P7P0_9RICK|nr:hypothetical protein [Candidatus Phycorickettsia trachydisci]AVP87289.1 hypothetical protein phytr_3360 [Candidatus Phycorickettsia trachydisci]